MNLILSGAEKLPQRPGPNLQIWGEAIMPQQGTQLRRWGCVVSLSVFKRRGGENRSLVIAFSASTSEGQNRTRGSLLAAVVPAPVQEIQDTTHRLWLVVYSILSTE